MFWKFVTGDTKSSSPASNSALRAIGSNDGKMYFINESTHALDFPVQTGGPAQSSATFVGRVAYFGGNDTNVYRFVKDHLSDKNFFARQRRS